MLSIFISRCGSGYLAKLKWKEFDLFNDSVLLSGTILIFHSSTKDFMGIKTEMASNFQN